MNNEEYYRLVLTKSIYKEPFDMKNAGDRTALQAMAKREACDMVEGHSQEDCERKLKMSKLRREFGRRAAKSGLRGGHMFTTDEEAFIDLYAETYYREYTLALAEKAGISVDPYGYKMPWGAWEFDFTSKIGRSDWFDIDELVKEQAVSSARSYWTAPFLPDHGSSQISK